MSASDRTRTYNRRKKAISSYSGTQKDDYTGTPGKRTSKPKPKAKPKAKARGARAVQFIERAIGKRKN
jgi:hypothetical protein